MRASRRILIAAGLAVSTIAGGVAGLAPPAHASTAQLNGVTAHELTAAQAKSAERAAGESLVQLFRVGTIVFGLGYDQAGPRIRMRAYAAQLRRADDSQVTLRRVLTVFAEQGRDGAITASTYDAADVLLSTRRSHAAADSCNCALFTAAAFAVSGAWCAIPIVGTASCLAVGGGTTALAYQYCEKCSKPTQPGATTITPPNQTVRPGEIRSWFACYDSAYYGTNVSDFFPSTNARWRVLQGGHPNQAGCGVVSIEFSQLAEPGYYYVSATLYVYPCCGTQLSATTNFTIV
jgi:hypothetical protein